jgi:alanine racemase
MIFVMAVLVYAFTMPQALISLDNVSHNVSIILSYLKPQTQILAAVKANAYGHGAIPVTRHLESLGIGWFGVATASEAIELRRAGIRGNILIFSPVYQHIRELVDYYISLTVAGQDSLEAIQAAKTAAKVHLKVDTGMGRLGLGWQESVTLAKNVLKTKLKLEGVWTHFATADDENQNFAKTQLESFEHFCELSKTSIVSHLYTPPIHRPFLAYLNHTLMQCAQGLPCTAITRAPILLH